MGKRRFVFVAMLIVGIALVSATGVQEPRTDFTLQLLHFADIDGQPEAIDNVGSFSRLVAEFSDAYPAGTLVVSSGDNFIPGPRYFAADDDAMADVLGVPGEGRADMLFLNAMGVTASAVGNHDLDGGPGGLVSAVRPESGDTGDYPGAMFPYLSANVDFSGDEATAPFVADGGRVNAAIPGRFAPSALAVVGGEVIGLVGASTPMLDSITTTGGLTVTPDSNSIEELAAIIQGEVDALTAQGVDKIVLLSHM